MTKFISCYLDIWSNSKLTQTNVIFYWESANCLCTHDRVHTHIVDFRSWWESIWDGFMKGHMQSGRMVHGVTDWKHFDVKSNKDFRHVFSTDHMAYNLSDVYLNYIYFSCISIGKILAFGVRRRLELKWLT